MKGLGVSQSWKCRNVISCLGTTPSGKCRIHFDRRSEWVNTGYCIFNQQHQASITACWKAVLLYVCVSVWMCDVGLQCSNVLQEKSTRCLSTCVQHRTECFVTPYFVVNERFHRWLLRTQCAPTAVYSSFYSPSINTLRTGDADLCFYNYNCARRMTQICVFNTRLFFLHKKRNWIMQYIEPVSEWSCWRMFIETWPHSELTFRHRASSI